MIKIRQAEKTLLNSALLTLMDIDTRGNWLHFLFNPISPINNGHGRPPCWVAIFCSFFWVNHPLMDPFWLRMNSSNANVIFYLASSMADHMPGFCRLTQFEYQFPIDMKYKVRIIIQVGKKWSLLFKIRNKRTSSNLHELQLIGDHCRLFEAIEAIKGRWRPMEVIAVNVHKLGTLGYLFVQPISYKSNLDHPQYYNQS